MSKGSLKAWALSLGCPKNRVDTERFLGSAGFALTSHLGRSDIVFINTCAFIESGSRESVRAILDVAKKIEKLKMRPLLVVAGCLPGRYGAKELSSELPEVDLWLAPDQMDKWPKLIRQKLGATESARGPRLVSGAPAAYLKISDGCNHSCAFCAIPAIRGPLKSEAKADILAEARYLVEHGAKELTLVAQDLAAWGRDQSGSGTLPALLEDLCRNSGAEWLRLLYLYPDPVLPEIMDLMTGSPLLPYLDIPLQHSEPGILAAMGRHFCFNMRDFVESIYKRLPQAALRTTFIVGYPGESEADFRNLCAFVREARFCHVGVFAFSAEEGTVAATLPNQTAPELREERRAELMALQAGISREIMAQYQGKQARVLVEKNLDHEWPGLYAGRTWFQAPEVDGITYISGPEVKTGSFFTGEVVDSSAYDLTVLA